MLESGVGCRYSLNPLSFVPEWRLIPAPRALPRSDFRADAADSRPDQSIHGQSESGQSESDRPICLKWARLALPQSNRIRSGDLCDPIAHFSVLKWAVGIRKIGNRVGPMA